MNAIVARINNKNQKKIIFLRTWYTWKVFWAHWIFFATDPLNRCYATDTGQYSTIILLWRPGASNTLCPSVLDSKQNEECIDFTTTCNVIFILFFPPPPVKKFSIRNIFKCRTFSESIMIWESYSFLFIFDFFFLVFRVIRLKIIVETWTTKTFRRIF